jgi:hypothetical protein
LIRLSARADSVAGDVEPLQLGAATVSSVKAAELSSTSDASSVGQRNR